MSTKMSTDMNITRPSSRVNRAPGGGSTLVFGDETPRGNVGNSPAKPQPKQVQAEVVLPPPAPEAAPKAKPAPRGKVAVLVAGEIEPDFLIEAIVKALAMNGIKGVVQSKIADVSSLPYAAQALSKNVDVVIAGAFMSDANSGLANSLANALMQAGLGNKPIVPAFVVKSSLLEGKAGLPDQAAGWARSTTTLLELKEGKIETAPVVEPVLKEKPVLTPTVTSVDTLMDILRESLKSHGASGIIGLGRKFRIVDDNNNGQLDIKEFSKAIGEHALGWSVAQIKAVFDTFDKDKSGNITYDEFLAGVRGTLNERRRQLVLLAFEVLDADKSGVIDIHDITAKYDASKHPDVISGKRPKEAILREFLDTFDGDVKDGQVTTDEFCSYYGNVSSSIDNDDYFELMIRNAWHISGGEGWCANSSCRRVLVTHTDGRQTVEEIKNDMGISGDDKDALLAKLKEQGVDDIDCIELSNGTKMKAVEPVAAPVAAKEQARPATGFNPRRQPGGASTLTLG